MFRVFEEEDSEQNERLVGNPIYSDSLPEASRENSRTNERENYDVLHHNMGMMQGVIPTGAYETISNLPNRASDRETEILQIDDASPYAKLGAEGIPEENVKVGVNEYELREPYANIFELSPGD